MPLLKITGLHAYLIFAVIILFAISVEHFVAHGLFAASNTNIYHTSYPSTAIGIELGRNYSRVAVFIDPVFEIIVNEQGRCKIPFGFEVEDHDKNGVTTNLRDLSPFLGREWSDLEFQASIENLPYDVVAKDGKVILKVPIHGTDTYLTAEEILSLHLTLPFYFNDTQTEAVNRAALSAGLNVQRLVSELKAVDNAHPTSSIITKRGKGEHNVPDYFLKCSIGDDWLSMSVKHSLRHNHRILGSLEETVSRDDFDFEWSNASIQSVVERIRKQAKISQENITAIVITGESPHVNNLKLTMESLFSVDKILKSESFGCDQAVVYGAASMAYWISAYQEDECVYPLDTTPLDLGIQVQEDIFVKVISKDIPIPVAKTCVVTAMTNDEGNVVISVYQGTSSETSENEFVGRIEFNALSMGPGVEVEVEVEFQMDFYGILTVVGTERKSRSTKRASFVVSTTADIALTDLEK